MLMWSVNVRACAHVCMCTAMQRWVRVAGIVSFTLSFCFHSVTKGRGTSHKERANHTLAVWIYARVFRLVRLLYKWQKPVFFFLKINSRLRRDALYTVWLFLWPVDPGAREERRGRVPHQAHPLQQPGLQRPETGLPSEEDRVWGWLFPGHRRVARLQGARPQVQQGQEHRLEEAQGRREPVAGKVKIRGGWITFVTLQHQTCMEN